MTAEALADRVAELRTAVAAIEARLAALTLAARNAPESHGGEKLRQALVAALESGDVPPVDALGLRMSDEARYIAVADWKGRKPDERATLPGRHERVLANPERHVRTGSDWRKVQALRTELGLA